MNKSMCRAKPPQCAPPNPLFHLSMAGETMELNMGKPGKDVIPQNSPFPNPTERSLCATSDYGHTLQAQKQMPNTGEQKEKEESRIIN